VAPIDDTGRDQRLERLGAPVDVQLEAGLLAEGTAPVGADLRRDALVAEERERTPRRCAAPEVEVERPFALGAKMEAARRVEERGELGEPVAATFGSDAAQLLADVLGGRQRSTPSRASRRRLTPTPAEP